MGVVKGVETFTVEVQKGEECQWLLRIVFASLRSEGI